MLEKLFKKIKKKACNMSKVKNFFKRLAFGSKKEEGGKNMPFNRTTVECK